jgi:hypothetical protein
LAKSTNYEAPRYAGIADTNETKFSFFKIGGQRICIESLHMTILEAEVSVIMLHMT